VKRIDYKRYLLTPEWRSTRAAAIKRAGGKCQVCGSTRNVEVHHLTYERLFHERPADLQVLCKRCHKVADAIRRRVATNKRLSRAMETYATKKYGEGWENWLDMDLLQEEFDAWLDSRR